MLFSPLNMIISPFASLTVVFNPKLVFLTSPVVEVGATRNALPWPSPRTHFRELQLECFLLDPSRQIWCLEARACIKALIPYSQRISPLSSLFLAPDYKSNMYIFAHILKKMEKRTLKISRLLSDSVSQMKSLTVVPCSECFALCVCQLSWDQNLHGGLLSIFENVILIKTFLKRKILPKSHLQCLH